MPNGQFPLQMNQKNGGQSIDRCHAEVYLVRLEDALPHLERLLGKLQGERKEKALRYVRDEDRTRSAVASLLLRRFVGQGEVHVGPRGKPFLLNGPRFNLSHAGDFIGIAIADEEVGFDVESVARCEMKIVSAAFTEEEAESIKSKEDFAYAWTRKEAVAKCSGEGLSRPRAVGLIPMGEDRVEYDGVPYFVETWSLDFHYFSIALKENKPNSRYRVLSIEELLD